MLVASVKEGVVMAPMEDVTEMVDALANIFTEDRERLFGPGSNVWEIRHTSAYTIEWELRGPGWAISLEPRQAYCDRGNWLARLTCYRTEHIYHINSQDGWPRY